MTSQVGIDVSVTLPSALGTVNGTSLKSGVRQWLGVPYAEPPTATREAPFEPPKPLAMVRPEMNAGMQEADKPAPFHLTTPLVQCVASFCPCACGACCTTCCIWCCCKTSAEKDDGKGTGLDVLRMNIWAPPATKEALPVFVFIHGGGDAGSGRTDDPNARSGENLAAAQNCVVCVIDFRQGIFGTMDWGSDVPTNLELKDMVMALQFLQDNVGAFGGDKTCVTIVGESIGGRRVCELLWCPAAKGLFHKAIATSPSAPEIANLSAAHRHFRRSLVNRYLGLPPDATPSKADLAPIPRSKLYHAQAAAKGGSPLIPTCKVVGASAEDKRLFGASAALPMSKKGLASAALGFLNWRTVDGLRTGFFDASVYDGEYMPSLVGDSPPACEVPLLLLFTKDEMTAIAMMAGMASVASRDEALERLVDFLPVRKVLDHATRTKVAGEYFDAYVAAMPGSKLNDVYVAALQDVWQYHACVGVGAAHRAALPGVGTYLASLVYDCKGKTPHGTDLSCFFGAMPGVPIHDKGKDLEGITKLVQESYLAFARTGNPSTQSAPFVPFDPAAPKMTLLDSAVSGGGSKVVETMAARDKAYRALVASIRAAEA